MFAIKARGLTKKFKLITAVDNVDLAIDEGECFGLLGPNGAGKTTMIRMITAASPPTGGQVLVLGKSLKLYPREIKSCMGVVPQLDNLDPDLSVLQNLLTFARYFSIPASEAKRRSEEVLSLFELRGRYKSEIRELSGGMKRRLLIARALLNNPRILVLDEPTVGLDPQARYLVWRKLARLKENGVTQLLSTQNMEEAAQLCDRVAIMHQGRIITIDAPSNLIAKYVGEHIIEIMASRDDSDKLTADLKSQFIEFEHVGDTLYIFHVKDSDRIKRLLPHPDNLKVRPATLEDVFFKITGRTLAE
jgi:lipooligosaccharide transport system ATP-binding protein